MIKIKQTQNNQFEIQTVKQNDIIYDRVTGRIAGNHNIQENKVNLYNRNQIFNNQ